jgi:hypothetical protein
MTNTQLETKTESEFDDCNGHLIGDTRLDKNTICQRCPYKRCDHQSHYCHWIFETKLGRVYLEKKR